jgi:hypothetical protein
VRSYLLQGSELDTVRVLLGYLRGLYPTMRVPYGQHTAELLLHCCLLPLATHSRLSNHVEADWQQARQLLQAAKNFNPELLVRILLLQQLIVHLTCAVLTQLNC